MLESSQHEETVSETISKLTPLIGEDDVFLNQDGGFSPTSLRRKAYIADEGFTKFLDDQMV